MKYKASCYQNYHEIVQLKFGTINYHLSLIVTYERRKLLI